MKQGFTKQDFYDLLKPNGDCLEWTKATNSKGYGITRDGDKLTQTHRLALELEGIDTTGHHVLHSCDNPLCCNPAHLRIGNQSQNMIDMVNRGRQNHQKLSIDDVIQIRHLIKSGMKQKDIADLFCVSNQQISRIKHKQRWSHI